MRSGTSRPSAAPGARGPRGPPTLSAPAAIERGATDGQCAPLPMPARGPRVQHLSARRPSAGGPEAATERTAMSTPRELANAIRALSMDAVQRANSGHPGMPMGMADIAEVLWRTFMRYNPANPQWFDRDRFVLSNGHGSMLLYSVLHLTGYPLTDRGASRASVSSAAVPPGTPSTTCRSASRPPPGPLGPGPGERGRHGARRARAGAAVQPPRVTASSITTPTRSAATAA